MRSLTVLLSLSFVAFAATAAQAQVTIKLTKQPTGVSVTGSPTKNDPKMTLQITSPPPSPTTLKVRSAGVIINIAGTNQRVIVRTKPPSQSFSGPKDSHSFKAKLKKLDIVAALQKLRDSLTQQILAVITRIIEIEDDETLPPEEKARLLAEQAALFTKLTSDRDAVDAALADASKPQADYSKIKAAGLRVSVTGSGGFSTQQDFPFTKPLTVGKPPKAGK